MHTLESQKTWSWISRGNPLAKLYMNPAFTDQPKVKYVFSVCLLILLLELRTSQFSTHICDVFVSRQVELISE